MDRATIVLIEDKASGTQLIQELTNDGLRIVKAVKPDGDQVSRRRGLRLTSRHPRRVPLRGQQGLERRRRLIRPSPG
jgi:phage terminase large subunit-like protein